jgi:toxin-antitoxin system PIN domain toxin
LKLIDANLLVYATNPAAPHHQRAAEWFDAEMNGGDALGLPWASLLAFLRVSTDRRIWRDPLQVEAALDFVQDWLEWESVFVPEPSGQHFAIVAELLRTAPRSKLVPDAHLAAIAIANGLTLCSADVDFRLFKGLRLLNPFD